MPTKANNINTDRQFVKVAAVRVGLGRAKNLLWAVKIKSAPGGSPASTLTSSSRLSFMLDDDPIARQVVHLISVLCDSAAASLSADFVARVSDHLSSGALAWSRRHLYTVFPTFSLCLSVNSGTAVET
ncbi:unnamed protein product [Prunus armeniaca]|uniref:Uncharacterized protein n=1 Tax=Prunus armeniaca TaxID=36596 RepID=A0A6J5TI58_PRUAR|nr:unnamed protein product [Prunus armeniaca]CAB4294187.1 unnamed protein product [Prunus armeniaca]